MTGCTTGAANDAETIKALAEKATPLSQTEQETLARSVFATITRLDNDQDPSVFERHYLIVIEKCPDTKRAHEAYWRLTNLYRQAFDEPQLEKIVKLLEQFLARYATSTVVSMRKYPDELLVFSPVGSLHRAYEELGHYDKIAAYYDTAVSRNESLSPPDAFDYATALDETQRSKDALKWYETFLQSSQGKSGFEFSRMIAENRIEELKSH
jgi:tetratricopeptide (TPR) repeat protein